MLVLEAQDHVGGRTRTWRGDGFAIDTGAIFVMASYSRTYRALRGLKEAPELVRWKAPTGLREGPSLDHVRFDSPASFLRLRQLSGRDRRRIIRAVVRAALSRVGHPFDPAALARLDDGRTMEQWSREVLGDRPYEYMVRALMEPLTGADLSTISASFLVSLLGKPLRTRLEVPVDGLDAIARGLLDGIEVRTSARVEGLRILPSGVRVDLGVGSIDADAVVVATDAFSAADLIEPFALRATAWLRGVQAIPLHHYVACHRRDPWPHYPCDLVVPVGQGEHSDVGVLLSGRRSPASVPHGGQAVSVYFHGPRAARMSESAVVEEGRRIVADVLGPAVPDCELTFMHAYGLSTAPPGHYAQAVEIEQDLPDSVVLAGDYFAHSGIEGAVLSGESAAAGLHQSRCAGRAFAS